MATEQTAPIFRLPNELLQHIIHISSVVLDSQDELNFQLWSYPEHSPANIKSIALTCRQLYLVCATFLWRDKEFILPQQHHIVHNTETTATTILSTTNTLLRLEIDTLPDKAVAAAGEKTPTGPASLQQSFHIKLGDYVRSLSRDLTGGPHFDLVNTEWLAQLVPNLRALRIDFHPSPRKAPYGLGYFARHCPQLQEIYLSCCQDNHGDFATIADLHSSLASITLLDCTIQQKHLVRLLGNHRNSIKRLVLQNVLIEPPNVAACHSMNYSLSTAGPLELNYDELHPFHTRSVHVTEIPQSLLKDLLRLPNLLELAMMTDDCNFAALKAMHTHAPRVTQLFITISERDPNTLRRMLETICGSPHLTVLNLRFSYRDDGEAVVPGYSSKHVLIPAFVWLQFAENLSTALSLLSISADSMVVSSAFFDALLQRPFLQHIHIWYTVVTMLPHEPTNVPDSSEVLRQMCVDECQHVYSDMEGISAEAARYLCSPQEAFAKGYNRGQLPDPSNNRFAFIKKLTPGMLR